MERTDYKALAEAVTEAWKNATNADNDPVTALQKRGAHLIGDMSAFFAKELESGTQHEVVLAGLGAMFSSEAVNLARSFVGQERQAMTAIVSAIVRYCAGALEVVEGNESESVKMSAKVDVPRVEVPN